MSNLQPGSRRLESESWCHTFSKYKKYSFIWKIDNFLDSPEEKGEFLESSTFPADTNCEWQLRIHPRGTKRNEAEDHVSLFLKLQASEAKSVDAEYKFSILDGNKEEWNIQNISHKFNVGEGYGNGKYVSREELSGKAFGLNNGELIIQCVVKVLEPVTISGHTSPLLRNVDNSLLTNYGALFMKQTKGCKLENADDYECSLESCQLVGESWCHTQRKFNKVSFTWKIDNFLQCLEKKGMFLSSCTFSAGNEKLKWRLNIYPKGNDSAETEDHVSLFLVLDSTEGRSVYGKFKLCILDQYEKETNVVMGEINTKCNTEINWGNTQFVSREVLNDETNNLLSDNHLLISCVLEVLVDPVITSGHKPTLIQDPLSHDLGSLLESQRLSDVIMTTADCHKFAAHKVILSARTAVFAAMFQHDMKENLQSEVEIVDIDKEVLHGMLQYIYTGRVPRIEDIVEDLLAASYKYELYGLQRMCEAHMMTVLSLDNAAEFLILADTYKSDKLKSKVIDFLQSNAQNVVKTDGWKALIEKHSNIIAEIMKAPEVIAYSTPYAVFEDGDNSLSSDLGSLFKSGIMSDVVLKGVDDSEFPIHKAILSARSPVFAAMFEHDMKENLQNNVKIADMAQDVLQGMLEYIYTDKVPKIDNIVEDLLVAADKYALDGLKMICEKHMLSRLSVDRAAEFLILADVHKAHWLKSKVIDFLKLAAAEVMKTNGWKALIEKHPEIFLEILKNPEVSPSLLSSLRKPDVFLLSLSYLRA